jgi:hypothetical protein
MGTVLQVQCHNCKIDNKLFIGPSFFSGYKQEAYCETCQEITTTLVEYKGGESYHHFCCPNNPEHILIGPVDGRRGKRPRNWNSLSAKTRLKLYCSQCPQDIEVLWGERLTEPPKPKCHEDSSHPIRLLKFKMDKKNTCPKCQGPLQVSFAGNWD